MPESSTSPISRSAVERLSQESAGTGPESMCSIRSALSYFSRIPRQCCQVGGSTRLIAANESTASVETSRSGSSGIWGSSSRRNNRASSTAMLRDDSPDMLIASESGNQFPGLDPVAAPAQRLKIGFLGLAALADRDDVVHF